MSEALAPWSVAVRELCAFTAKTGDLDLRFTPSPTAQEGVAGHRAVAARRPSTRKSEVTLQGVCEGLRVRGRADGYDPSLPRLEEVKTCRGSPERVPSNHRGLHWAQAETYAHLACSQEGLAGLTVALVYFDIASQHETVLERAADAASLKALFEDRCRRFRHWAEAEAAHRRARNQALAEWPFPHEAFRPGQRELAVAVYRGVREGRCVLAQAPTGIGKTVGTLLPALKALATLGLDKVFFLTAKISGRRLALDGLRTIAAGRSLPLRVIELVARERACEHPGKACHGDACPLAQGFYDRLPAARQAGVDAVFLDSETLRAIARSHRVCPYYLGQELAKWCDVVVGDYNHYFDAAAMLHSLSQANEWQVAVLVDEAHNLVERGRAMYSATLATRELRAVTAAAGTAPPVRRALQALDRAWDELPGDAAADYRVLDELPPAFAERLDTALAALSAHQAEHPAQLDPPTLQLYFELGRFARLASVFGPHSMVDSARDASPATDGRVESRLCLRNVVPAPHLAPRFVAARSVTLFSATLTPTDFYRQMLGLPADSVAVTVGSPFLARQLSVRTTRHISTRWRDRAASVEPIARLIAEQLALLPGNYLAFFSSFAYLAQVADVFESSHPGVPTWRQSPHMTESAQQAFVDRFRPDGGGVGFAVLGGRFGEGIDLPGRRLVGAFIATLGLPQTNPVNEQLRERIERQFGRGYDYAYLYPGLRKVVQAAGRVIRTVTDEGVVHLIDDRYALPKVRALLPAWWDPASDLPLAACE
ncbi:MAG: ATP-dependent DNA helicase [Pseudomonadota bacterium]|nr:ATP-dependent DNA helicase [Pseudomonadota bacterium]